MPLLVFVPSQDTLLLFTNQSCPIQNHIHLSPSKKKINTFFSKRFKQTWRRKKIPGLNIFEDRKYRELQTDSYLSFHSKETSKRLGRQERTKDREERGKEGEGEEEGEGEKGGGS